MKNIVVLSKDEIKKAVTCTSESIGETFYNWFKGEIHCGNRYVEITYYYTNNRLNIVIFYKEIGKEVAVAPASRCSSYSGLIRKIATFLKLE